MKFIDYIIEKIVWLAIILFIVAMVVSIIKIFW
jgi:hypothetical protein